MVYRFGLPTHHTTYFFVVASFTCASLQAKGLSSLLSLDIMFTVMLSLTTGMLLSVVIINGFYISSVVVFKLFEDNIPLVSFKLTVSYIFVKM